MIEVVNVLGSDLAIVQAAGLCYDKDPKNVEKSIYSLMRRGHWSPFEFGQITVKVQAPIFVARQWMRHRAFSYMETSLRYTEAKPIFMRIEGYEEICDEVYECCWRAYQHLLDTGISKEKARMVLPLALYTTFLASANVRDWCHFLRQRCAREAQEEIREYAWCFFDTVLSVYFPITARALREVILEA